ncbi:hypothetical protein U1Q18_031416, partial [Sarracenia purpurea var. burkii]
TPTSSSETSDVDWNGEMIRSESKQFWRNDHITLQPVPVSIGPRSISGIDWRLVRDEINSEGQNRLAAIEGQNEIDSKGRNRFTTTKETKSISGN